MPYGQVGRPKKKKKKKGKIGTVLSKLIGK